MSLIINQTHAKIGIERVPGRLEIRTRNAVLELHQEQAKVNIQTELPKIEIDQREAFADIGLKSYRDLAKEMVQMAYQNVMQYIAKTASDGDRLAAIELGGNPLADIAERDAFPEKEFGYDYIPKTRPKISLQEGKVHIDVEPRGVEANYIPGDVEFNFIPTKINIYMRQYNSISFEYKGTKVDTYL